ncbi:MAG: hypothetical protein SFX73_20245 [Kofleriaceae bacterium]|nr:hypothetical protein [Kofleriaceae bacterium]
MHSFVILEKADRVGGTWRDNTYPGAACVDLGLSQLVPGPRRRGAAVAESDLLLLVANAHGPARGLRTRSRLAISSADGALHHVGDSVGSWLRRRWWW